MYALRLTEPLDSWGETYILAPPPLPGGNRDSLYKGLVRPVLDYGSSVWDPPGIVLQEELESVPRCQICDRYFQLWNWEYEWHSWTVKMGIPQEKEERQ